MKIRCFLLRVPSCGVMNADINAGAIPRLTSGVWNQTSASPSRVSQIALSTTHPRTNSNIRSKYDANAATKRRTIKE
jgi:hypothetical protein